MADFRPGCVYCCQFALSLSLFLSPFSSPGRLSNREEMLGISRCRTKDQMCGLEVVRQTKYKPAYRDTSEDGGQQRQLIGPSQRQSWTVPICSEEQDALLRYSSPNLQLCRPKHSVVKVHW